MKTNELNRAEFIATLPPIMSAIKIYGDATGMRFQLEVPESEMVEAAKLLAMRGKVLKIVVEVEADKINYGGKLK